MKKLLLLVVAACLTFGLAACGSSESAGKSAQKDQRNAKNDPDHDKSSAERQQEWADKQEEKESKEQSYDEKTGEGYMDGLGYVKTLGVGFNDEVGIDGTDSPLKPLKFGSMELTIDHLEIAEIQPDEDNKPLFGDKDKVKVIVVDMNTENKSDDDIEFYPSNSIMVTDTGEQIEDSEMLFSGEADGEFHGKVKKEGQGWWLLDKDEDIKNVKMIISPAYTDDMEDIGNEKRLDFEILPYKDALKKDRK